MNNWNPIQEMREEERRNPFVKKLSDITLTIIFGVGIVMFMVGVTYGMILLLVKMFG